MIVKSTTPVVVPAVPEIAFPDIRYLDIRIHKLGIVHNADPDAPPEYEEGIADITYCPWSEEEGKLLTDQAKYFRVDNIAAKAAEPGPNNGVSDMGMAWYYLVKVLEAEQIAQGIAAAPESP